MTWHWTIVNGSELQIWDHTQDPELDAPLRTETREFWTYSGDYPPAILDLMYEEATQNHTIRSDYAMNTAIDAAFDRIVPK